MIRITIEVNGLNPEAYFENCLAISNAMMDAVYEISDDAVVGVSWPTKPVTSPSYMTMGGGEYNLDGAISFEGLERMMRLGRAD